MSVATPRGDGPGRGHPDANAAEGELDRGVAGVFEPAAGHVLPQRFREVRLAGEGAEVGPRHRQRPAPAREHLDVALSVDRLVGEQLICLRHDFGKHVSQRDDLGGLRPAVGTHQFLKRVGQ